MKIVRWSMCAVALMMLAGCASSRAPLSSTGSKIDLLVVSDRGNENEMGEKQWRYRNEIGNYMEVDLIRRLNGVGYNAKLIKSKSECKPAADRYLVLVKITMYNPGSAAARFLVGYGAGACSVDVFYAVYDSNGNLITEWSDGVGSAGDWRRLPITLNKRLITRLNTEFAPKQ